MTTGENTHDGAAVDRVALVTGGSHGLGPEIVRQLADRGGSVVLAARDGKAEAAVAGIAAGDVDIRPVDLDITDEASVANARKTVQEWFGRLDVLVNNAGVYSDRTDTVETESLDSVRSTLETNLLGTWRVTQAFLPLLRRSAHARIVLLGSGGGSHGDPDFGLTKVGYTGPSYGVSKAAVHALTSKLAAELADTGILVNTVCPGLVATYPEMAELGARPIPEGAAGVVWAAELADDGPTGGFFRDGRPMPW